MASKIYFKSYLFIAIREKYRIFTKKILSIFFCFVDFAARCGTSNLTHEAILTEVRPKARSQVPDYIKADLLKEIRTILDS